MAVLKKARGLHTFNSEINEQEGALDVADNVVIDADDTIESRRGYNDFGDSFATGSDTLNQQFVYKDRILRHFNDTLQFDSDGNGTFSAFDGTYSELIDGLRIKSEETKGNLFFTTDDGIKKISAATSSDFTTASGFITDAGIPKAVDLEAELKFVTGGFLPPQSKVAYRVLFGKRDANNILLLGSPSARYVLSNNTNDINTAESFTIDFTTASETDVEGSYILFSSVNTDYFLWFSNTANPDQPTTAETLSRQALEVDVDGIGATTADIINLAANKIAELTSEFSVEISGTEVIVTSLESGNDLTNAALQSGGITNLTLTVTTEGSVTSGSSANGNVTFTIPADVDSTDFFYQIYRTAVTTATTEISLEDIDPGDEMNLVQEANLTAAEISAGEVVVEDITPESFRENAAFLYTNPNTGEGILQSNERPPIAHDLSLFRNSLFYANTKTTHKQTINLLAVTDFTSGVSDFIIGNEDTTRTYTFIGETEVYDITTDTFANTTADSVILVSSARDERNYYIWFDKGGGTDPAVSERERIRLDISGDTTAADISATLATTLDLLDDFNAVDNTGSVRVTLAKNGNTTDPAFGTPAPGGSWALASVTQGDGEDVGALEVLLSSETSAALAIDETARSLVKVINRDASSPVNAFYLSGPDDLPGIISLENRSLEDKPFFLATSDTNITSKFNPELPLTETLTAISIADPTEITSAGHGLSTGDTIYIYATDSTPALLGKYTVTVTGGSTFTVPVNVTSAGTTGIWFKTDIESTNDEVKNRLFYSKLDQPEAVPLTNFIDIGPRDKAIDRIIALRDNLMVLKEDAVYIVTGTSAPDFSSRLLDSSTRIIAPDSAVVLNNKIYALSTQGVVSITESGISIISRPIEDRILRFANSRFDFKYKVFGVASETDRAYHLWAPTDTFDEVATQCYRFNIFTRTWTRWTLSATCGVVNSLDDKIYLGAGDRNFTIQERKNGDRTDYADRDITISIPADSVEGTSITLSSASDAEIGDALVQTQYVTIAQYNRLLLKLDLDKGLDDTDYFSTLEMVQGENMRLKLDALNTKLVADDSSGTITAQVFSADFETQQTEYNDQIDELNNAAADTLLKDYKQSEGTIPYEATIVSVDITNNSVTVDLDLPYIFGTIEIYKGIFRAIQWVPQHFGDDGYLKQVREGKIFIDQTNFKTATIAYASDRSTNFEEIDFTVDGPGFFGGFSWGEAIWGGLGNEVPLRTLVPKDKQRCRHIKVRFEHINARENARVLGIDLEPRAISKRAYR